MTGLVNLLLAIFFFLLVLVIFELSKIKRGRGITVVNNFWLFAFILLNKDDDVRNNEDGDKLLLFFFKFSEFFLSFINFGRLKEMIKLVFVL